MDADDRSGKYTAILGTAVVALWSRLPQDVQHDLFEEAILAGHADERDESLREALALFLHDHHHRTADV